MASNNGEIKIIPVANTGICPIMGEYVSGKVVAVTLVETGQSVVAFPISRRAAKEHSNALKQASKEVAEKAKAQSQNK